MLQQTDLEVSESLGNPIAIDCLGRIYTQMQIRNEYIIGTTDVNEKIREYLERENKKFEEAQQQALRGY